ncbi:hypothetical protein FB107DRAFT_278208 [Schizophyllum commune]
MISKARGFVHLDSLESFGAILRRVRRKYGRDATLVVCKSEVAQACRRILMHPLWYIRRTVFIKGYRYVDRDNGFGDCVAGAIWIAFFCLIIWITIYVKLLADLLEYVDDVFSWELADACDYYELYQDYFQSRQVPFPSLLDELGIPHERPEQLYGERLEIICFVIDPNAMTITASASSKSELVAALRGFAVPHTRRWLREF